MTATAQRFIEALQLQPHPEGGYFRETYRCPQQMPVTPDAVDAAQTRSVSTGIYFLLEQGNFSAFHKIQSDEMWHFYAGQTLEVLEIAADGSLRCTRLGADLWAGEVPQYVVSANTWFASRVVVGGAFALVGCTVAPGFDFADFRLAERAELTAQFPALRDTIALLTR